MKGSKRKARIPSKLVDELLSKCESSSDLTGPDGLLNELVGALVSRAMGAELTDHLGYEAGDEPSEVQTNRRNGYGTKRVRTKLGQVDVRTPRDRDGSFEPQILGKRERQFDGFDEQILPMYARGMSVRDIKKTLGEIYGVDVSASFISNATDAVVDELRAWQYRPLEAVYAVVYIDALFVGRRQQSVNQAPSATACLLGAFRLR